VPDLHAGDAECDMAAENARLACGVTRKLRITQSRLCEIFLI